MSPECYINQDNSQTYETKWYITLGAFIVFAGLIILGIFGYFLVDTMAYLVGLKQRRDTWTRHYPYGKTAAAAPTKKQATSTIEKPPIASMPMSPDEGEGGDEGKKQMALSDTSVKLPAELEKSQRSSIVQGNSSVTPFPKERSSVDSQERSSVAPQERSYATPQERSSTTPQERSSTTPQERSSIRETSVEQPMQKSVEQQRHQGDLRLRKNVSSHGFPGDRDSTLPEDLDGEWALDGARPSDKPPKPTNSLKQQIGQMSLMQNLHKLAGETSSLDRDEWDAQFKNDYYPDDSETSTTTFPMMLIGNFVLFLKFMYLSLARKTLELFDCTLLNGKYFFEAEPSRFCFTEPWYVRSGQDHSWLNTIPISILLLPNLNNILILRNLNPTPIRLLPTPNPTLSQS